MHAKLGSLWPSTRRAERFGTSSRTSTTRSSDYDSQSTTSTMQVDEFKEIRKKDIKKDTDNV